jgi:TolB-like protein/Tfp pilus assembly protein PilF
VTVAGRPEQEKPVPGRRKAILIGTVALLVVAVAAGIWQFNQRKSKKVEAASVEKMAYPLPDRPSYAVLPFVNVNKESDLGYLCDGLTETIISILSQNPYIFVIASNTSFTYKGKPVKIKTVAEELGVQYVIEGSIQKSGDQLRIAVQLIDALTGRHIWSERFDRSLKDLFKLQDEIVLEILKSTQIDDAWIGKIKNMYERGGTNSIDAQLKFLDATYNFRHRTEDGLIKAKQLFEEAIAIDPNFAMAHAWLSISYQFLGRYYSSGETSKNNLKKGLELAEEGIELNPSCPTAHAALGYYYSSQRKYDMAINELKKAIELNPTHSPNRSALAQSLLWIYKLEESVYHLKEAIRTSPLEPVYYIDQGRRYFHLKRYEDAIRMHKKALELSQRVPIPPWWPHLHIAMVYSELGREKEAREHMKKLLESHPKFNLKDRRNQIFFVDPANTEREIEALRKAGAPERPPS